MTTEDCEPASPPTTAPPAHTIRRDTRIRRAALTGAVVAGIACVTLFALHLTGHLPLGRLGTAIWCAWLLAAAMATSRIAYQRVPAAQLADDWADRLAFGDAAALPFGDPALDPLLAATSARCVFSRPSTWRLFGIAGGLCWGGAVFLSAAAATGHVHPAPVDLLFGLALLLSGAVQLTCFAVTAPSIYGQRTIRQAGALAHQRLRALQAQSPPGSTGSAAGGGLHLVTPRETGSHRAAQ